MKISFNIDYRTNWGESVYLMGNIPELGNGDESQAKQLNLNGSESWSIEIEVADSTPDFQYQYFIRHENGYTKKEWGKDTHSVVVAAQKTTKYSTVGKTNHGIVPISLQHSPIAFATVLNVKNH